MPHRNIEERRKCQKKYYKKNKKKIGVSRNKRKTYRLTKLGTSKGTFHGLIKRPYPKQNNCELCKRKIKRLVYHHWDDNNLNLGVWVCGYCHKFTERFDSGFSEKYVLLKRRAEVESPKHIKKVKQKRNNLKKYQIIVLLKKGMSGVNISKKLSVCPDYVSQVKNDHHLPTFRKWTGEKKKFLQDNYGIIPAKEIAKKLGFSLQAVYAKKRVLKLKRT